MARLIFCSSNTVGIHVEMLPFHELLCVTTPDSVTVILTATSRQTRRRLFKRWLCHVLSRRVRLVGFSVSKWLKPHSLFRKSNFATGKPTRSTKNEPLELIMKYLLLSVSKSEVFRQNTAGLP